MARQDKDWETFLGKTGVVLVDCRNADELLNVGRIETAVHVPCRMADDPDDAVAAAAASLPEDKATPIVTFCAVGGRSERVKEALLRRGYANVTNGGGYPSVKAKLDDEAKQPGCCLDLCFPK